MGNLPNTQRRSVPNYSNNLAQSNLEKEKSVDVEQEWIGNEANDEPQKRIDEYMEDTKEQGGISGMLARATDFIGDDLFNLW